MEDLKGLLTVSDEAIEYMRKLVRENCDHEITEEEIYESDLRFIKKVREIDAIKASSFSRGANKVLL